MFPIEGLRALNQEGMIGSLANNFLACMGGIYSQRAVIDDLAPQLVQRCIDEKNRRCPASSCLTGMSSNRGFDLSPT
ncbi:MAG: hypothetical protein Ct9H90mP11_02380 [Acidimicrobiales bacterium]|nr:MAG: hypothetical protein Ct9H90mP11_02380 [Acidimicrobiales bacterium]